MQLRSFDILEDASLIVASHLDYSQNIRKSVFRRGAIARSAEGERITTGNQIIEGVVISPEGSLLAYDSDIRGAAHIYTISLAGGFPHQVTTDSGPNFVYSWSPSGGYLAYHRFDEGIRNVYAISRDGLEATRVSGSDDRHERYPSWSQDEGRIAYQLTLGGTQLIVQAVRGADGSWSVPDTLLQHGAVFKWAPVGNRGLFRRDPELIIRDFDTGIETVLAGGDDLSISSGEWSDDGTEVVFLASPSDGPAGFWIVPAGGGTPEQILTFGREARGFIHFDILQDEIYYTVKETESDIWVIRLESPDRQAPFPPSHRIQERIGYGSAPSFSLISVNQFSSTTNSARGESSSRCSSKSRKRSCVGWSANRPVAPKM